MVPEPLVVRAMREFRADLLAREAGQMAVMVRRWGGVEQALQGQVDALVLEFAQRKERGEAVGRGALYRLERYQTLLGQTQAEFASYAEWSEGNVSEGQEMFGLLGSEQAVAAIGLSYQEVGSIGPFFDRLPVEAVQAMVGIAGNGRPLGELLRSRINPSYSDAGRSSAWQRLTQSLVNGTALGWNPRKTARQMMNDLAEGLNKALLISRTEQLRVYRQAAIGQYQDSGVVRGQKRLTAHDPRVCAACIADEGTVYPITATIPDHPQGRCTGVPVVIGLPEVTWEGGEDWFRNQPRGTQVSILGSGRLGAWEDGAFGFGDLVTRTRDDVWGAGLVPTPLKDLV